MISLDDYREVVGEQAIAHLIGKARKLYGKHILHINSTYQGGGVAELLESMIPLMNDIGVDTGWRILHGNPDFFSITKKFHNAILGQELNLSEIKKRLYTQANEDFSKYTHIFHDLVVIHDPQPLPLIKYYKKKQPWFWRCHIDLSSPNLQLWDYFKKFLLRYDVLIVSNENYIREDLPVDWKIVYPAINPLSPKNMDISEKIIAKYLKKFGVPTDKPIITQISRFDKLKDPEGVVDVFKLVKKEVDARMVLCGSMASDDPEGGKVYERVRRKANHLIEKKDLVLITVENDLLVNVLQRSSSVIIQKSLKEGFGLTVTEALWKEKPVVASKVGGIPLQIKDSETGFLLDPEDIQGFAEKIVEILQHPKLGENMGKKGKEIVRDNYLITRLMSDYLDLFIDMLG